MSAPRMWNEPKTLANDRRTLADHLVSVHGTPPIPTYAANDRILRDAHADLHKRPAADHQHR